MPNLSASSTTIIVAFGTSTPTSITVVATNTSNSRSRNLFIVNSLSLDDMRPCNNPSRKPCNSSWPKRSNTCSADATSNLSLSSINGHTTKPCCPAATASRISPHIICSNNGPAAHFVTIGVRPGGSSSNTLTSKSPYTVIAAVRGIGVAVITNTSGVEASAPFLPSAARCSTPNRCCSSITTTPRLANCTPS